MVRNVRNVRDQEKILVGTVGVMVRLIVMNVGVMEI
jgi:hypothetical protein